MRIEHAAMYVRDLEGMREFYEKYFGAVNTSDYHNQKTGLKTHFLKFDGEARLELMTRPDMTSASNGLMDEGYIHLAFSAGSKENVDELTERLASDGFKVISGPRTTGDGYYESCVLDPEGNQIEIVA